MGFRPTFVKLTKKQRQALMLDDIAQQRWFNAMSCWFEDKQVPEEEQFQLMGGNGKDPSAPKQRQVILQRMLADGLADYLHEALEAHMMFRGEYHLLKRRLKTRLRNLRGYVAHPPWGPQPGDPPELAAQAQADLESNLAEVKNHLRIVEGLARSKGWTEFVKEDGDE